VTASVRWPLVARAAVAVLAIVVIAWLAVMERNQRLQATSLELVKSRQGSRAESNLKRARFLNPDSTPDLTRAALFLSQGERGRALALLKQVVRREPDNLRAWGEILVVSNGYDAAAAQLATDAFARLDPLDARR
jgi:predicted Zn-dependent protease